MRALCLTFLLCLVSASHAATVTLTLGKARAQAEIATTPHSREHGLMRRTRLCADCGMVFVYEQANRLSFWMKDTPLPLSIAFINDNGRILNIAEMQAATTDRHDSMGVARYALEMNSGWFARQNIVPGARVLGLEHLH